MFLKKVNGEEIAYHRIRTPAAVTAMFAVGYLVSFLMHDQYIAQGKLETQRLARRIGLSHDDLQLEDNKYENYPKKVPWKHILKPGAVTFTQDLQKLASEEQKFERDWYRKYMLRRMKDSMVGPIQVGMLNGTLPFAVDKLIARQSGSHVTYRHPQTTLAFAGLLSAGYIFLCKLARYRQKALYCRIIMKQERSQKQKGHFTKAYLIFPLCLQARRGQKIPLSLHMIANG